MPFDFFAFLPIWTSLRRRNCDAHTTWELLSWLDVGSCNRGGGTFGLRVAKTRPLGSRVVGGIA
jgi:hypothetical protein